MLRLPQPLIAAKTANLGLVQAGPVSPVLSQQQAGAVPCEKKGCWALYLTVRIHCAVQHRVGQVEK
jgi:hypothetical protein